MLIHHTDHGSQGGFNQFATRAEARQEVTEYIEIFCNRRRKQARLGYLSSAAFTQRFNKMQLAA